MTLRAWRILRAWSELGFAVEAIDWAWPGAPKEGPYNWRRERVWTL